MGIDLHVVFAAKLTAEQAFALPERLNTTLGVVAACRDYYKRSRPSMPGLELEPWRWEEFQMTIDAPAKVAQAWEIGFGHHIRLSGTPGTLRVGPDRVVLGALSKLAGFATDYQGCQTAIRVVSRAIAHALETDRVLYIPDSGDWPPEVGNLDAGSFDELLARLTAWGPPVPVIGALGYPDAVRNGFHYADGALRRPDGTAVPDAEIIPGRNHVWSGGVARYLDGRLVSPEELARPDLRDGFGYYVDDFHDLA